MDVPVARGRGRSRNPAQNTPVLGSPLRRPYNTEDALTRKLKNLTVSAGDGDVASMNLQDVITHIRSAALNEEDLNEITEIIHNYCAEDRTTVKQILLIYQELGDLAVGNTTFRALLLRKLQQDFQDKDVLEKNNRKFINLAVLLCEVFHLLRPNGTVYEFLCYPVVEYLKILLHGSSDIEIEIFADQFGKNGRDLAKHADNEFQQLLINIRKKVIYSDHITSVSRKRLLFCLECSLSGWAEFLPEVQKMYK